MQNKNRLVTIHRPNKEGSVMMGWITSILRKIVFAACAGVIAKIVASGVLTEAQITTWIELSIATIVAAGVACWTKWIGPWIASKFAK